jgi:hypothetical protein
MAVCCLPQPEVFTMKRFACVLLLALGCMPPGEPAKESAPAKESHVKALVSLPPAEAEGAAEWVRVGGLLNVVVESPGGAGGRVVFEARTICAVEGRDKRGLAVTLFLTPSEAKALELLTATGQVSVERYESGRGRSEKQPFNPDGYKKP